MPVQPRTPKQTHMRSFFTSASSAWRALTSAQQTAWNNYAAQLAYSDSLGSSYSPTGQEVFVSSSVAGQNVTLTVPPSVLPTYILTVTGMSYVDPTPGPEALSATLDITSADNTALIETSGPVSPGITSAAAVRRWRSLPVTADNLAPEQFDLSASPVDLLANYKFLFPSPPSGSVIWFRFREAFLEAGGSVPIANKLFQTFRLVVP